MGPGLVIGGVRRTFAGGEHNDETGMSFNMSFLAEHSAHEKLAIRRYQKRSFVREHISCFIVTAPVALGLLPTIQNYIQTVPRALLH